MMELQTAYDELKSRSEKEISDLRVQISSISPSTYSGKCTVSIFFQANEKQNVKHRCWFLILPRQQKPKWVYGDD